MLDFADEMLRIDMLRIDARRQRIEISGLNNGTADMMGSKMQFMIRSLAVAAALAATTVMTASAAVLVDDYSIPALAGGISSNGALGPVLRTDNLVGPYAFPVRDANVTSNSPLGLVTATIGSGFLVNASSSAVGGALTLTYYGGPAVDLYAGGGTQLDLNFFSIFPVSPMSVVATANGVNSTLPVPLLASAVAQTISIPYASFLSPPGLGAVTSLELTFNFAGAGFFTLDSITIPTAPPIGAVPEPGAVVVWLLVGLCGVGLVKVSQKRLASAVRG